jgi:hypothetical protein
VEPGQRAGRLRSSHICTLSNIDLQRCWQTLSKLVSIVARYATSSPLPVHVVNCKACHQQACIASILAAFTHLPRGFVAAIRRL